MILKRIFIILLLLLLNISVCFGAAATMYVTVAGAGDNSGDSWTNAMALSDWETDMEGSSEAGDIYYVAGGTYDMSDDGFNVDTRAGSIAASIRIIGVVSGTTNEPPVIADYAYGDDRPLITMGAQQMLIDDYWIMTNFRLTTTYIYGFRYDTGCILENCYFRNSSASADYRMLKPQYSKHRILNCEIISDNGWAVESGSNSLFKGCYIHDSKYGAYTIGEYSTVQGNVIDTCSTAGIYLGTFDYNFILDNTFYNCGIGIQGDSGANYTAILSNIFDANTTGVQWGASSDSANTYLDYNIWDNSTDVTNVVQGKNAITGDPGMTAPADGDFTVGSGSNALDAGMQVGTNQGATGDYKWNIGVDQDDVTAAGGGGGRRAGWSIQ